MFHRQFSLLKNDENDFKFLAEIREWRKLQTKTTTHVLKIGPGVSYKLNSYTPIGLYPFSDVIYYRDIDKYF